MIEVGMRIAYLTHYTELYGANRSLIDLVLELRARHPTPQSLTPAPRRSSVSPTMTQHNDPSYADPSKRPRIGMHGRG